MKLANALAERADLQTRISQLQRRLSSNALVQEGEAPAEDPRELLRELDRDYARLEQLIAQINHTNSVTLVEGESLSALLARRDCLTGKLGVLQNFITEASTLVSRHTASEIKVKSTVDVRELRKQADQLARQLRELDAAIQEKNWTTELAEE